MKAPLLFSTGSREKTDRSSSNGTLEEQLVNGCILAASLTECPLKPDWDYPEIQKVLADPPSPEDISRVAKWVVAKRGHTPLSVSWQGVLKKFDFWLKQPILGLPFLMVIVAIATCVLTFGILWCFEVLDAPARLQQSTMRQYDIPAVLTKLVLRFILLLGTFLLSVWSLTRAILYRAGSTFRSRDAGTFDQSWADRFTDWVLQSIGRLKAEYLGQQDEVAQGTRSRLLGILGPNGLVLSAALLLMGALFIGNAVGHFVEFEFAESYSNGSTPLWGESRLGKRGEALKWWLALTLFDSTAFAEESGDLAFGADAPLMRWLEESDKKQSEYSQHVRWRDGFSRLISKSNRLLAALSAIPLIINLVAFFPIWARRRWTASDASRLVGELPLGYRTCGDLVEEIREWRPPPSGPDPVATERQPWSEEGNRTLVDEVWMVPLHSLLGSAYLRSEAGTARLAKKLARPLQVFDASTPVLRSAFFRNEKAGIPKSIQPVCIVFLVHAPASPSKDILDFIGRLTGGMSASAPLIVVADRQQVSIQDRPARDQLWRGRIQDACDFRAPKEGCRFAVTTPELSQSNEKNVDELAQEIKSLLSPKGLLPDAVTANVDSHEAVREQHLRKAYTAVASALLSVRDFSGRHPDLLLKFRNEKRQQLAGIFSGTRNSLDEMISAAGQQAGYFAHVVAEKTLEGISQGRQGLPFRIEALETLVFRLAVWLTGITASCLFLGLFPILFFLSPFVAFIWIVWGSIRFVRAGLAKNLPANPVVALPLAVSPEDGVAFMQDLVSTTCSLYYSAQEDRDRYCRAEPRAPVDDSVFERFPNELDLRARWLRCFPHFTPQERHL